MFYIFREINTPLCLTRVPDLKQSMNISIHVLRNTDYQVTYRQETSILKKYLERIKEDIEQQRVTY